MGVASFFASYSSLEGKCDALGAIIVHKMCSHTPTPPRPSPAI
jgi:hypothetical protein